MKKGSGVIKSEYANTGVNQLHLANILNSLFGDYQIITNARKEGDIKSPQLNGMYLELDFWIPALRLAFEYQDPHHYVSTWYANASLSSIQLYDKTKKDAMEERGDSLVVVPCWWTGDVDSLVSTIKATRRDLLPHIPVSAPPIDSVPPPGYFKERGVPGIGELMTPSFQRIGNVNLSRWWISEKYDGVRICWQAQHKQIYSRFGRKLTFLPPLVAMFPDDISLDCEAWTGRDGFREVQELTRFKNEVEKEGENEEEETTMYDRNSGDDNNHDGTLYYSWDLLRVPVFDTPDSQFTSLDFGKRFEVVNSKLDSDLPFLTIAPNMRYTTTNDLFQLTQLIIQQCGEGIVARNPETLYTPGLSDNVLKYKANRDFDALVIDKDEEYIYLQMANGTQFKIAKKVCNPSTGKIVSVSYIKYSSLGPVNPKIDRIREDIDWADVLNNVSDENQSIMQNANLKPFRQSPGFWLEQDNVRSFFDQVARRHNLDPSDANSWYDFTVRDIVDEGGSAVLKNHSYSLYSALRDCYPDVEFLPQEFSTVPRHYWASPENRRNFFMEFAAKKGFDPLDPSRWYLVSGMDVLNEKGGRTALYHHGRSLSNALISLFPNIGLEKTKFTLIRGHFISRSNKRAFFEQFAQKRGLDPLNPSSWKYVTLNEIRQEMGGASIMNQHGTLSAALEAAFPEMNYIRPQINPHKYWKDVKNRRNYFESIAKARNFDPLDVKEWYQLPLQVFVKYKGFKSVLSFHNGSLVASLQELFPDSNFDPSCFSDRVTKCRP